MRSSHCDPSRSAATPAPCQGRQLSWSTNSRERIAEDRPHNSSRPATGDRERPGRNPPDDVSGAPSHRPGTGTCRPNSGSVRRDTAAPPRSGRVQMRPNTGVETMHSRGHGDLRERSDAASRSTLSLLARRTTPGVGRANSSPGPVALEGSRVCVSGVSKQPGCRRTARR